MDVVGVAALLPPAALDGVAGHLRVVGRHDGVGRGLLGCESEDLNCLEQDKQIRAGLVSDL